MNNLSKIEKGIIEYLVTSDTINDSIGETDNLYDGMSQKSGSTIETLILTLFSNDDFLVNTGLIIDFDNNKNEYTIHVAEQEFYNSIIIGNWNSFQKVNYFLVKTSNFLNQLEREGYLDKVSIREIFNKNEQNKLPYSINSKPDYKKTLEIKNQVFL